MEDPRNGYPGWETGVVRHRQFDLKDGPKGRMKEKWRMDSGWRRKGLVSDTKTKDHSHKGISVSTGYSERGSKGYEGVPVLDIRHLTRDSSPISPGRPVPPTSSLGPVPSLFEVSLFVKSLNTQGYLSRLHVYGGPESNVTSSLLVLDPFSSLLVFPRT